MQIRAIGYSVARTASAYWNTSKPCASVGQGVRATPTLAAPTSTSAPHCCRWTRTDRAQRERRASIWWEASSASVWLARWAMPMVKGVWDRSRVQRTTIVRPALGAMHAQGYASTHAHRRRRHRRRTNRVDPIRCA